MRKTPHLGKVMLVLSCAAGLAACSSTQDVPFPKDELTSYNVYTQAFPGGPDDSCEASRRALLSQGYVIQGTSAGLVRGRKHFQPNSDTHLQVEFHVVCAANSKGSNSTTVFANAVRDRYVVRKSTTSASLGVGALGSVSLPIGSSSDSLVKVASETIPSKDFYDRFFELVESYLDAPLEDPVLTSAEESQ